MNSSSITPNPIIAIVGPTASGKSDLGLAVALRFGGEIINCDSVQVYREIDVATAKVPFNMRRGVPHHLIDFVPPEINYTAGDWARDAETKIAEIEARGALAMLVGGTGFYLRALRNPFFPSPATNAPLRQRLNKIRERHGAIHLHDMLRRVDAASAAMLYPRDWPRVQRALEIRFQTKGSMAEKFSERMATPACASRIRVLALNPPRAELYNRIEARTEAHFALELIEEAQSLLERGIPRESNALGAHGYRRAVEFLKGERSIESAVAQATLDVRHYAKRQLTWFRREPGVEWFAGFGDDGQVQERVIARVAELQREMKSDV